MKTTKSVLLVLVASAMLDLFGCAPTRSANEEMAEKNKAIMKKAYDYFNVDDWDSLGAMLTSDFVDHNPAPGQKPGFEGVKESFKGFRAGFPDMKMTAHEIVAEGDWAVARITMSGTHKGEFMGMPATGNTFSVQGFDLVRFANGKVAERWGTIDNTAMMTQLGMMPMPGRMDAKEKGKKK